jgi:hypothetical protein
MPPGKCSFKGEFQWRELPFVNEGETPEPDYRVMFWWNIILVLDPLLSLKGTLTLTYAKFLNTARKWVRGTPMAPMFEKLFDRLPQSVIDALEFLQLKITPEISGGSETRVTRRSPDDTLDIGPDRPQRAESTTSSSLKIEGVADTGSLLSLVGTQFRLEVSLSYGSKFRVGIIASLEPGEERLGLYVQPSLDELSFRIRAGMIIAGSRPDIGRLRFTIAEQRDFDPLELIILEGSGIG